MADEIQSLSHSMNCDDLQVAPEAVEKNACAKKQLKPFPRKEQVPALLTYDCLLLALSMHFPLELLRDP